MKYFEHELFIPGISFINHLPCKMYEKIHPAVHTFTKSIGMPLALAFDGTVNFCCSVDCFEESESTDR